MTNSTTETQITTFGPVDQRAYEQLVRCAVKGDAGFAVLCADHHVGYSQPIGGAIAYERFISPSGVGYDIGWGNKAVRTKDIELRGGGADEAPGAYKRMDEVLAYHGDTIRVLHRLRPLGVAMAGEEIYDPYKD